MCKLKIAPKVICASLIVCLGLTGSPTIKADSYNKYVGQTFILPIPKSPVRDGYVNSWSYSCSNMSINVKNGDNSPGGYNPSEATIVKYFDGSLTIECFFQYIYYINNTPHSATSREYHTVSCIPNDISIDAPFNTLEEGEGMQMTYRFAHSTYDSRPEITWRSSSDAVRVNNNGYVSAISEGTATIYAKSNLGNNEASFRITVNKNQTDIDEIYAKDTNENIKISGGASQIVIQGISGNNNIAIYSIDGILQSQMTSTDSDVVIPIHCPGTYIIKYNQQSYKINVK